MDWFFLNYFIAYFNQIYSKLSFFKNYVKTADYFDITISCSLIFAGYLILVLQGKYGPRVFLKKYFKNQEFNYFIEVQSLDPKFINENPCPICYCSLDQSIDFKESQIPELFQNLQEISKNTQNVIMKTPCNHFYHTQCLVSSMHYKMRCAVCRQTLPEWY